MSVVARSYFVPLSSSQPFILEDVYFRGGLRVLPTTVERDAIPALSRKPGMMVITANDKKVWQLGDDKLAWTEFKPDNVVKLYGVAPMLVTIKGVPSIAVPGSETTTTTTTSSSTTSSTTLAVTSTTTLARDINRAITTIATAVTTAAVTTSSTTLATSGSTTSTTSAVVTTTLSSVATTTTIDPNADLVTVAIDPNVIIPQGGAAGQFLTKAKTGPPIWTDWRLNKKLGTRATVTYNVMEFIMPDTVFDFVVDMSPTLYLLVCSVDLPDMLIQAFSTNDRNDTNPYTFRSTNTVLIDDGSKVLTDGSIFYGRRYKILTNLEPTTSSRIFWRITNKGATMVKPKLSFTFTITQ